jgi:hypothetical protein
MRQELLREMGTTMPRGGGVPFTGELRQAQVSDVPSAWNMPVSADPSAASLPVMPCHVSRRGRDAAPVRTRTYQPGPVCADALGHAEDS